MKIYYLLLSVALSVACVACGDDEPDQPSAPDNKTEQNPTEKPGEDSEETPDDPTVDPGEVTPDDPTVGPGEELESRKYNVSFSRAGGHTHVDVPVDEYTTEIVKGMRYCTVTDDATGFTIEMSETTPGKAREAIVTLSYAGRTYEFTVMQNAFRTGDAVEMDNMPCTVFETDGYSGKVFAPLGRTLKWGDDGDFGTASENDGLANTRQLMSQPDADVRFPAAYACTSIGEGWYLPAVNELKRIGFQYDLSKYHWSSTATSTQNATAVLNGDDNPYFGRGFAYHVIAACRYTNRPKE